MELSELAQKIETVRVMQLQPSDRIVVRFKSAIPQDALAAIRQVLEREFPGRRVLILDGDTEIEIVRGAS